MPSSMSPHPVSNFNLELCHRKFSYSVITCAKLGIDCLILGGGYENWGKLEFFGTKKRGLNLVLYLNDTDMYFFSFLGINVTKCNQTVTFFFF